MKIRDLGQREFLAGAGEMAALMRAKDWSQTPLGPIEQWPQSLRTLVGTMLASSIPMLLFWGRDYLQLYNDGYIPVFGPNKHPQALGKSGRESWHEVWDYVGPRFDAVMTTAATTSNEDQLFLLDRQGFVEECYFTFSYSPVRDETGRVAGVLSTCVETTHRVIGARRLETLRALAALPARFSRWSEVVDGAAAVLKQNVHDFSFSALYLRDADDGYSLAPAARELAQSGLLPETVQPGRDGDALARLFEQARHAGRPSLTDTLSEAPRSAPVGVWKLPVQQIAVAPLSMAGQSQCAGFLVAGLSPRLALDQGYRSFIETSAASIVAALSHARAYEDEANRARTLEDLDRLKTEFFSNISHEFRTPITLMLGPAELLLSGDAGALPEAARRQIDAIYRNARRLLKLVNALLDFSRIEAGRVQASFQPTDLSRLTAELSSMFRAAIERAGLRLEVDCPPLPAPVHVDRDMWEKIVLNLLSNALKFTFEGEIRVSLASRGDEVVLAVADSGVGVPGADLPRLFQRFHRVRGTRSRTHEGSGIGLSLVHELARLHGGRAWVESVQGRGTTVWIAIPTGHAHLPEKQVREAPAGPVGVHGSAFVEEALRWLPEAGHDAAGDVLDDLPAVPASPGAARGRVLVADDNSDLRAYLGQLLAPRYHVEVVADGKAALAAALACPHDLVLADVMMPGLDGLQLLKALKSDPRTIDVPVILLSARAGEESRIEGVAAGADDYLVKPFSARELLARIDARLELARLRRASEQRESKLLAQISEGKSRVEAILASINDAFAVFDADWRYTYVNEATVRMGRRTREQLIGNVIWDCFPDLLGSRFELEMRRIAQSRQAVRFEFCHQRSQRWFDVRLNVVAEGVSVLGTEITERKRGEQLLRSAHDELEQMVAARTAELAASNQALTEEVAERRRIERALRASEARFRTAFEDAAVGMAIGDRAGRLLVFNAAFERLIGRTQSDPDALDIVALTHPEDRRETLGVLRRLTSGETESAVLEKRYLDPGGRVVWAQDSLSVVRDDDGALAHLIVLSQDISARKQAEAALRAGEARFRSLTELSSDWYWEQDAEFRFTYVSPGYERINHASPQSVLGKSRWEQRVFGLSDQEWLEHRERLEARKPFANFEYGYVLPDGSERWGRVSGEPIFDAKGDFCGYRGVTIDVTEARRGAKLLRDRERLLEGVLDALPVGVWIAEASGRIVHGNPAGRRIWAGERYVGIEQYGEYRGWWSGTDRLIQPHEWALARAIERGETSIGELIDIQCFDGTRRTILNSAVPLRDEAGRMAGAIVVNEDVTVRRKVEAAVASVAAGLSAGGGRDFFSLLAETLAQVLGADCAFIVEVDSRCQGRTLAAFANGSIIDSFEYDLRGSPCEQVVREAAELATDTPRTQFARTPVLDRFGMQEYAGTPLMDSDRQVLGLIFVANSRPFENLDFVRSTLHIMASRAAAELERMRNEQTIRILVRAGEVLHSAPDLSTLERSLASLAVEVSRARACRVALRDDRGRYRSKFELQEDGWQREPREWKPARVLAQLQPGTIVSAAGVHFGGSGTLTALPLASGDRGLLGFVELYDVPESVELPRIVRERLLGLAQIASIAVERALSMDRVQRAEIELRDSESRLRALAARLQSMLEDERARIAREIHDVLGQALTGLKLDIAWLRQALPAERADAVGQLQAIGQSLDGIVQMVRRISSDLRPGELDDLGLVAAIESLAQEFQARTGIRCRARLPDADLQIESGVATALFRICQELLTNVIRHARASHVALSLEAADDKLVLVVRDDGRGMRPEQASGRKGLGLLGIQERARMFGGSVEFDCTPGNGLGVTVRMPAADVSNPAPDRGATPGAPAPKP